MASMPSFAAFIYNYAFVLCFAFSRFSAFFSFPLVAVRKSLCLYYKIYIIPAAPSPPTASSSSVSAETNSSVSACSVLFVDVDELDVSDP